MTTEQDFVRELAHQFPVLPPVEIGIGDDGAVLRGSGDDPVVVVTDMLLDGVHFDLKTTPPRDAGRKAIAVNISDLAAMGCRPTAAFVSIAVPRLECHSSKPFLNELYLGIAEILAEYQTTLAGGDTNSWDGPFAINVCLTGLPWNGRPVLRSTAQPGQRVFVTGPLGGSYPSSRHLKFRPRLAESEWLVRNLAPRAMMDLSDGLSLDLQRLAEASGVGVEIDACRVPIHGDVPCDWPPQQRLNAALNDGEDFELLLTISEEDALQLSNSSLLPPFPMIEIGRIIEAPGCWIIHVVTDSDDRTGNPTTREKLLAKGWQHSL